MLLDNGLTSAFTAAVSHLERSAELNDLSRMRVAKLKKDINFVVRDPRCCCVEERPAPRLPRFLPLVEVEKVKSSQ